MPDKIMVSVLVRASWSPDLEDDVEYPTIEDYAARLRQQFDNDPLGALTKLPDPKVVEFAVNTH